MVRYAKNVRLASFLALTCSLRLSLALSGSDWISSCLSLTLYGSLWLLLWLTLALTATLWHTLALSGSLLLSNFAYTGLDRLTGSLLGSHRRCHDDALYPALAWTKKKIHISLNFCQVLLSRRKNQAGQYGQEVIAVWHLISDENRLGRTGTLYDFFHLLIYVWDVVSNSLHWRHGFL